MSHGLTAAIIPMENSCCSCKLTRWRAPLKCWRPSRGWPRPSGAKQVGARPMPFPFKTRRRGKGMGPLLLVFWRRELSNSRGGLSKPHAPSFLFFSSWAARLRGTRLREALACERHSPARGIVCERHCLRETLSAIGTFTWLSGTFGRGLRSRRPGGDAERAAGGGRQDVPGAAGPARRTLFGHFLDTFWTLFGHLLYTCCTLVGHLLDTFWALVGHLLDTCWILVGHLLDTCWILVGREGRHLLERDTW